VDAKDPNAVHVDGVATGNAYSFVTITTDNANMLLDAGTYYFYLYGEDGAGVNVYFDLISVPTGEKRNTTSMINALKTITITEPTYVSARLQVPSGTEVKNQTVRLYASKLKPLEYVPYREPSKTMIYGRSVVECLDESDQVVYYTRTTAAHETVKVATFNVGGYGYDETDHLLDPVGDITAYREFIGGVNADIMCTQEDRIYWNVAGSQTTRGQIYDYMYTYGGIVSNSISTNGMFAKGIYSSIPLSNAGKYTFESKGVDDDGTEGWTSFTRYIAEIGGEPVLVISVHLQARRNAELHEVNMAARRAQIQELLTFVDTFKEEYGIEHAIIAGDFNNWSDEMDAFKGQYVMANCDIFGTKATYDSTDVHPFDNILVTPNIKMRGVTIHKNDFKDHFAVSATLTV
jgi:endonuclease/exonuclease/phosphatase family metal-dependent hydrolase